MNGLQALNEILVGMIMKEPGKRSEWIDKQAKILLEEDVGQVIDCLKQLPISSNKKTELQKNKKRIRFIVYF